MKTKLLATLAVLAMAFAGVAVLTDMEQDDAAASAYAPGAYGVSETNGLRAIAYIDSVILVDTNNMDNLADYNNFYVKVDVYEAAVMETVKDTQTIGPIALQNGRVFIDATVLDDTTNKYTKVSLFGYGQNLAGDALDYVTFVYTEEAAELVLGVNHSDEWATVNDENGTTVSYTDFELDSIARNGTYKADETLKVGSDSVFDGIDYGYNLKGWSKTYNGVDAIALEKTDKDDEDDKVSIEEIIFAAGAITDGEVKLFAIWEKAVYNIYVYDTATSKYIVTDKNKSATVATGITAVASSIAPGAGYGILRIAQETVAVQNVYTITLYKDAGTTEVEDDGTEGSYTFLDNGTYRLNVTKNDLYVEVTAEASTNVTPTAYSFGIDSISNKTGVGVVNASLDLFDYAITGKEHVKFEGTYYKAATTDGQRIYGNIANLDVDAEEIVYTMSVDNGDYEETGQIYAALDDEDPHAAYDVKLTLGTGISFYAAKGIFDVDSSETADAKNAVTPWSLVTA